MSRPESFFKADNIKPTDFAFPYHDPADSWLETGLTKREFFAAVALQGICARGSFTPSYAAENAVRYADALIAELNKEESGDE